MPKTQTKRVGSDKLLAKLRKPAGRINQDDRRRASKLLKGLGLTAVQKRKLVKNLKDTCVISSDIIKAGASMVKAKKPDITGLKRGGRVKR